MRRKEILKKVVLIAIIAIMTMQCVSAQQKKREVKDTAEQVLQLEDVVVNRTKNNFGVKSSQISAISISKDQIFRQPVLLGEVDLMKTIQRMPGVHASGEGQSGIIVRGGDYDQNLLRLDGVTIYGTEHLKGYTSVINPDVIGTTDFYRGAFPARFGSRVSSVVDVTMEEGNLKKYHGSLTVGLLASKLNLSGPIWKGHTSFNLGVRASYYGLVIKPLFTKVNNQPEAMRPFASMDYYDVNAKITHYFSKKDKLSFLAYFGNDNNTSAPTISKVSRNKLVKPSVYSTWYFDMYNRESSSKITNTWNNLFGNLAWEHKFSKTLMLNLRGTYSRYRYKYLTETQETENANTAPYGQDGSYIVYDKTTKTETYTQSEYHSNIDELAANANFDFTPNKWNDIKFGVGFSKYDLEPTTRMWYAMTMTQGRFTGEKTTKSYENEFFTGEKSSFNQISAFVEDDLSIAKWLKVNAGVRLMLYSVSGKSRNSIEPRVSLSIIPMKKIALKFGYARTSQALHLLTSNNLSTSRSLWVPITKSFDPIKSDIYSVGVNYEISNGLELSAEGYYKTLNNVLEYGETSNYEGANKDWTEKIYLGKGRAFGVELLLQKTLGKTTGWFSYTWSKSLRTFDRDGMVLNHGEEFYSSNDHRNNLGFVLTHTFDISAREALDLSVSWHYQTGRRGTLTIMHSEQKIPDYETADNSNLMSVIELQTAGRLNQYVLPATHHLDVNLIYKVLHPKGESHLAFGIYNLYSNKNIASAFIGIQNNEYVLKGISLFPFMPSISYTYKF